MQPVEGKKVFTYSKAKSEFTTQLNPTRVCGDSMEQIESIAKSSRMSKAEVIRYCVEFALLNADWVEAADQRKTFRRDAS
jgi:streptomycin 6-kinase